MAKVDFGKGSLEREIRKKFNFRKIIPPVRGSTEESMGETEKFKAGITGRREGTGIRYKTLWFV